MKKNFFLYLIIMSIFLTGGLVLIFYIAYVLYKKGVLQKTFDYIEENEDKIVNVKNNFLENLKSSCDDSVSKFVEKKEPKVKESTIYDDLNSRQTKLLNLINDKKIIRMKEVRKHFDSVTPRTLRRDLDKLEDLKLVRKEGATRNSRYMRI